MFRIGHPVYGGKLEKAMNTKGNVTKANEMWHGLIQNAVNMWQYGMITDAELCFKLEELAKQVPAHAVAGALDINTGLCYTETNHYGH